MQLLICGFNPINQRIFLFIAMNEFTCSSLRALELHFSALQAKLIRSVPYERLLNVTQTFCCERQENVLPDPQTDQDFVLPSQSKI